MVFSSVTFLYYFLPAFLVCYFAAPGLRARNLVLLAFSLVFYSWGGIANLMVLAVSMVGNYLFALLIGSRPPLRRLPLLAVAVTLNLAGLVFFKYAGFLAENLKRPPGAHRVRPAGDPHRAAARHLLLHLPRHLLSGGHLSREGVGQ